MAMGVAVTHCGQQGCWDPDGVSVRAGEAIVKRLGCREVARVAWGEVQRAVGRTMRQHPTRRSERGRRWHC